MPKLLVTAMLLMLAGGGCLDSSPHDAPSELASGSRETETTAPAEPTQPSDLLESPPSPEEPRAEPPPILRQYGCHSFYAYHAVAESFARANLPEGFGPVPYTLTFGATSGALFASKVWRCERSTLGEEPIDANEFLLYYLATVPPEPFRDSNLTFYWYPLEVISATPEGTEVLRSWNMNGAVDGEIQFVRLETTPSPSVSATAQSASTKVDFTAILEPVVTDSEFKVRYFGSVHDGVASAVDITVHEGLRAFGELSLVRIDGPNSPWTAWERGRSDYQGWPADGLSYTWTYVDLPAAP